MLDYYQILGVSENATSDDIKQAYKKLCKKFHPDMNDGDKFFEEKFKEIQAAYEVLSDNVKRNGYNLKYRAAKNPKSNHSNSTSSNSNHQERRQHYSGNPYTQQQKTHQHKSEEPKTERPKQAPPQQPTNAPSSSTDAELFNPISIAAFILFILLIVVLGLKSQVHEEPKIETPVATEVVEPATVTFSPIFQTLNANFYKQFIGQIGDEEVIINLHYYDKTLHGNCFFSNGYYFDFHSFEDENPNDDLYILTRGYGYLEKGNQIMKLQFRNDSILGSIQYSDEQSPVRCKESYQNAALKFDTYTFTDSNKYHVGLKPNHAFVSYNLLIPTSSEVPANANLINGINRKLLTCQSKNINECVEADAEKYFKDYLSSVKANEGDEEWDEMDNHYQILRTFVAFNQSGILSLEVFYSEYSGGAHGFYGSTFWNYDVLKGRAINLEDIIKIDTVAISQLLEKKARKNFNISPDEPLSSKLLVDTIPITNSVSIRQNGIVFTYPPYNVASYSHGQIDFLLEYGELEQYMLPSFRVILKRMRNNKT